MNQVLEKIKELEAKGEFNTHLKPVDWQKAKPVDAGFPYIPKGFKKLKYALINFFIVRPFRRYHAKTIFKVKTIGKKNLKGIKSAILTSNHIAVFDCMAISFALNRRKLKFVVAEFNNQKGWFGEAMRAHGILPLSSKYPVLKKFNNALEHHLLHGNYVLVYPEEAMWDFYPKPRPFKNGAFYYAAKFNVPVVPIFITMRDSGKKNKDGSERKYFTVNISKPVYPNPCESKENNAEYLKNAAYSACVQIYENAYEKK